MTFDIVARLAEPALYMGGAFLCWRDNKDHEIPDPGLPFSDIDRRNARGLCSGGDEGGRAQEANKLIGPLERRWCLLLVSWSRMIGCDVDEFFVEVQDQAIVHNVTKPMTSVQGVSGGSDECLKCCLSKEYYLGWLLSKAQQ